VPVALIGLIGYVFILGSLVVRDGEEARLATLALTFIGFGFSAYLTYRELFSIHAVCEECAASAVFLTILLVGAVARYLAGPSAPRPAPATSAPEASVPEANAANSLTVGADGQ
jgi:uncharacterized membrane protein